MVEKEHKCVNCGNSLFKIIYDDLGVIHVLCDKCDVSAISFMPPIITIPLSPRPLGVD